MVASTPTAHYLARIVRHYQRFHNGQPGRLVISKCSGCGSDVERSRPGKRFLCDSCKQKRHDEKESAKEASTRVCIACDTEKPYGAFRRRGARASRTCIKCQTKHSSRTKQARNVGRYRDYKESHPCTDCGRSFPYYVMQFDHRPGETKIGEVSVMLRRCWRWERIEAEIAKCDLVCANCHAIRTHKEKAWNRRGDGSVLHRRKRKTSRIHRDKMTRRYFSVGQRVQLDLPV